VDSQPRAVECDGVEGLRRGKRIEMGVARPPHQILVKELVYMARKRQAVTYLLCAALMGLPPEASRSTAIS
jgi:hypothetical protein